MSLGFRHGASGCSAERPLKTRRRAIFVIIASWQARGLSFGMLPNHPTTADRRLEAVRFLLHISRDARRPASPALHPEVPMADLTHFNERGEAHMVDIAAKEVTHRRALAEGLIRMQPATLGMIAAGEHAKGDVLGIARVAGIMGAKRTADLVPLCHPLALTRVDIVLELLPADAAVRCIATVETRGRTGVDMEALCAVQVTLLTIYDMCKAVDRGMTIDAVRLLEKAGGRSGEWRRDSDRR